MFDKKLTVGMEHSAAFDEIHFEIERYLVSFFLFVVIDSAKENDD
jgi:hypothetical protein